VYNGLKLVSLSAGKEHCLKRMMTRNKNQSRRDDDDDDDDAIFKRSVSVSNVYS
jgi:hypothetical protein